MPVSSIGFGTKLVYGFGTVAYGIKDNGFNFLLLIFYNQLLGLPAQLVGFAIMIALIIDGFLDPLIGHVSDRFHSRLGRRHPFMYASALPCALVYYLLWNPPSGLGHGRAVLVPAADGHRRAHIDCALRGSLGGAARGAHRGLRPAHLLGGVPILFRLLGRRAHGRRSRCRCFCARRRRRRWGCSIEPGYHGYSIAAALCMFGSILISTAGTHHYIPYLRAPPPKRRFDLAQESREIRGRAGNRPFLSMLACGVFSNMAFGLLATLSVYFYTYFWELSADQVSGLLLSALISAGAALVVAPIITKRLDKKRGAIVAAIDHWCWRPPRSFCACAAGS